MLGKWVISAINEGDERLDGILAISPADSGECWKHAMEYANALVKINPGARASVFKINANEWHTLTQTVLD